MPWFDATTPTDSDYEGNGNVAIQGLKTTLNLLDGVVLDGAGRTYQCVEGWPRTFVVATWAALPAAGVEGRLAWVTDTCSLWHDDGGSWVRVVAGPVDYTIPLGIGLPVMTAATGTEAYADVVPQYIVAGAATSCPWSPTFGYAFNRGNHPSGATIKLVVGHLSASSVQIAGVRLWDVAAAAAVEGSNITCIGGSPPPTTKESPSADISGAFAAGDRVLRLQLNVYSGGVALLYAGIRVQVS